MVVAKTYMKEIPQNCAECSFHMCDIPMTKNGNSIMKSCLKKRHKCCPLIEVKEEERR